MDDAGQTDAPVEPCAECAAASQRQVIAAVVIGAALGAGVFYVLTFRAG